MAVNIPDERMILLMEYAIKNGIALTETDYWQKISYPRTGLANVRKGIQSFRIEHIINACQLTGASADWVLGLEKSMFRDKKVKTTIQKLKEVTAEIEQQLKGRSRLSKLLF
jgi:hypothetical protein